MWALRMGEPVSVKTLSLGVSSLALSWQYSSERMLIYVAWQEGIFRQLAFGRRQMTLLVVEMN